MSETHCMKIKAYSEKGRKQLEMLHEYIQHVTESNYLMPFLKNDFQKKIAPTLIEHMDVNYFGGIFLSLNLSDEAFEQCVKNAIDLTYRCFLDGSELKKGKTVDNLIIYTHGKGNGYDFIEYLIKQKYLDVLDKIITKDLPYY